MAEMELKINGQVREVTKTHGDLLLWVLRDELGMTGTKFGCGVGICGACTVLVDGVATRACVTPIDSLAGKDIRTIEGLAEGENLHPVQQAFIDKQVPQCGWCMSGQIMTAAAFLQQSPQPTDDQINEAMSRNICRCGCYVRIREAVAEAAAKLAQREAVVA
jgi:isoquinoline 1-oxidoreductase alpha subunit